jgi:hypothetical protein
MSTFSPADGIYVHATTAVVTSGYTWPMMHSEMPLPVHAGKTRDHVHGWRMQVHHLHTSSSNKRMYNTKPLAPCGATCVHTRPQIYGRTWMQVAHCKRALAVLQIACNLKEGNRLHSIQAQRVCCVSNAQQVCASYGGVGCN